MAFAIIIMILLLVAALVGTFKFILPERRKPYLSPFLLKVHDFLSMKELYLEKVMRTLYVIITVVTLVLCLGGGIVMTPALMASAGANFGKVLLGILLGAILGAILSVILLFFIRIGYESAMLKIMLTDAAKAINNKMGGSAEPRAIEEPRRRPAAPRPVVCRRCGARYDPRRGYCPNCDERW